MVRSVRPSIDRTIFPKGAEKLEQPSIMDRKVQSQEDYEDRTIPAEEAVGVTK